MRFEFKKTEKLSAHNADGNYRAIIEREKIGVRTFESIAMTRSGFWVCVNISADELCEMTDEQRREMLLQMTEFVKKHDSRATAANIIEWDDVCECGLMRKTHTHFRGEAVDRYGRSIWIKPVNLCEK